MKRMRFTDTEVFLLHSIVISLDRIARSSLLADVETTYNEFLVLMAVRELAPSHGNVGPTHREVESYLDTPKALISQRVRALSDRGLIVQSRNSENRREVLLRLTSAGDRELDVIYRRLSDAGDRAMSVLGARRDAFRSDLAKVLGALVSH